MPITHPGSTPVLPSWHDVSMPVNARVITTTRSATPPNSIIRIRAAYSSSSSKTESSSQSKNRMKSMRSSKSSKNSRVRSLSSSRANSRVLDQQFQHHHDTNMSRQRFTSRTTRRPSGSVTGIGTPLRRQQIQQRQHIAQLQQQELEQHQLQQQQQQQQLHILQLQELQQQQRQNQQIQPKQQMKGKPLPQKTKFRSASNPRGYSSHSTGSVESLYSVSNTSRRNEIPAADSSSWDKSSIGMNGGQNADEDKIEGAKRVIEELNRAIGPERRIAAVSNACAEFDHWDTDKHNAELQLGSANTLSLFLSMTDDEDEVRMICAALEMVYRASTEVVRNSFQNLGPSFISLLLKILQRCEEGNIKNAEVSLLNISKVLLYFSRVAELRDPLARHPELLDTLTRVGTSVLNPDCRVLRMRVIANLSNSEDNKLLMMEHNGLLPAVLKVAALDLSLGAREYASACLMDIASSPITQITLAKNEKLLSTLVKLAVTDEKDETREYAITAMQNLAFSKGNRSILVHYSNGVVLEALKKIVSSDSNDKARRRAAGALTNLACDETANIMASHNGLIDAIANVTTHDNNYDVQKRACLALTKIASSCTPENKSFEKIMSVLITAAASPNSTGIPAVFRLQARDTSSRAAMARLPGILETLADMSSAKTYSQKDKENAMRAIMHLTNENKNRKILCSKVILNALVQASNIEDADMSETRDSAIVALERLATEVSNRQYMARHDNLLITIAKATERESKSALGGEQTTQPRLAKQLLMSLLLAM